MKNAIHRGARRRGEILKTLLNRSALHLLTRRDRRGLRLRGMRGRHCIQVMLISARALRANLDDLRAHVAVFFAGAYFNLARQTCVFFSFAFQIETLANRERHRAYNQQPLPLTSCTRHLSVLCPSLMVPRWVTGSRMERRKYD